MDDTGLTPGEIELLVDGRNDDVSLVWALIHLVIRSNPDERPGWKPSQENLHAAFESFRRLIDDGYAAIGSMRAADGGPPGRLVPHEHVSERHRRRS